MRARDRLLCAATGACVALAAWAATAEAADRMTRYSPAGGCYQVASARTGQSLAPGAGPFRMQAAALGAYLLCGVPATACAPPAGGLGASGRGPLRLGAAYESILYAAGQPSSRPGSAYRYCVSGHPGATLTVVFSARGKAVAVGGNWPGLRAGSVAVSARAAALEHVASSLGRGLWLGRGLRGGARYVYGVNAGRVAVAAVVARARPGSGALAAAFR